MWSVMEADKQMAVSSQDFFCLGPVESHNSYVS